MTPDDLATTDALAVVEAVARHEHAVLAPMLATMDKDDLLHLVTRLATFVDLRSLVGTDQPDTVSWSRWLRSMPDLVI